MQQHQQLYGYGAFMFAKLLLALLGLCRLGEYCAIVRACPTDFQRFENGIMQGASRRPCELEASRLRKFAIDSIGSLGVKTQVDYGIPVPLLIELKSNLSSICNEHNIEVHLRKIFPQHSNCNRYWYSARGSNMA